MSHAYVAQLVLIENDLGSDEVFRREKTMTVEFRWVARRSGIGGETATKKNQGIPTYDDRQLTNFS